jgi:hypothetical protein
LFDVVANERESSLSRLTRRFGMNLKLFSRVSQRKVS